MFGKILINEGLTRGRIRDLRLTLPPARRRPAALAGVKGGTKRGRGAAAGPIQAEAGLPRRARTPRQPRPPGIRQATAGNGTTRETPRSVEARRHSPARDEPSAGRRACSGCLGRHGRPCHRCRADRPYRDTNPNHRTAPNLADPDSTRLHPPMLAAARRPVDRTFQRPAARSRRPSGTQPRRQRSQDGDDAALTAGVARHIFFSCFLDFLAC
jgi:hypothetical protein